MFSERVSAEKALEIGLIDQVVNTKEELMEETMKRARFIFTKNQTVLHAVKLCSNHFLDKSYNDAYEIEKLASAWYEHGNKDKFINDFRKKFE